MLKSSFCLGQNNESYQASDSLIKALQDRISSLEKEREKQEQQITSDQKKIYDRNYNTAIYAISLLRELDRTIDQISASRNKEEAYAILMSVNNPTSTELGFSFSDKLMTIVNETIDQAKLEVKQKTGLKTMLGNLITGLSKTFPPLNIATSIISSLASFSQPVINLGEHAKKILKKGDEIIGNSRSVISDTLIANLSKRIRPFIDFYTSLNEINAQYQDDLTNHSLEYNDLAPAIKKLTMLVKDSLNVNIDNIIQYKEDINRIFSLEGQNKNPYASINTKKEIKLINSIVPDILDLANEFIHFYKDYYKILVKNYDKNLKKLEHAKSLEGAVVSKIDLLIERLRLLRVGDSQGVIGFEKEFQKNISDILVTMSRLKGNK